MAVRGSEVILVKAIIVRALATILLLVALPVVALAPLYLHLRELKAKRQSDLAIHAQQERIRQ